MVATVLVALASSLPVAEPCGPCHQEQQVEYAASAHAHSTVSPLYLAMRRWAEEEAGPQTANLCQRCHTLAMRGQDRTDRVVCQACHQAQVVAELTVDPHLPVAASRPGESAPHPVLPLLARDPSLPCSPCHFQLENPHGVPLCTTGPEAASRPGGVGCLACHPPHTFPGTDLKTLAKAANLLLDQRGDRLLVTVVASGVGHALPTGTALRQVQLVVDFFDARGKLLWSNRDRDPVLFARVLEDAEGRRPSPPWRAVRVAADTRLSPGERRVLTFPVPRGAREASAALFYHRAPAHLLRRFALTEDQRFEPRLMVQARLPLAP